MIRAVCERNAGEMRGEMRGKCGGLPIRVQASPLETAIERVDYRSSAPCKKAIGFPSHALSASVLANFRVTGLIMLATATSNAT